MKTPLRTIVGIMFFLICATSLLAQPTIDRNDLWMVGDTYTYLGLDATNLEPGPSGNGVTWDMSVLVRNSDLDGTSSYVNAADTPNAAAFPEANIALTIDGEDAGTAYSYYSVSNDSIVEEGQDTPAGLVILENKRVFINFPFGYNDTHTDTYGGSFTLEVNGAMATVTRQGTFTTTYDGFGTLILGSRTFTGVSRIKTVEETTETIEFSGMTFNTTTMGTSYSWFNAQSRDMLLNISEVEATGFGPPTSTKSASYQDLDGVNAADVSGNYGAHLTTQGGDFDTEIIVHNPTDPDKIITLNPLASDGSSLTSVDVDVPGEGLARMNQQNIFPPAAASFTGSGCDECSFTMGYRANLPNASTAHVNRTQDLKTEYYFYPGEWDLLFDGASIVNAGSGPATVTASQIGDDGGLLSAVTLTDDLEPGGKFLDVFNGKFANVPNSILKIESTQPIAVMILRISQDRLYLYQNLALPDNIGGSEDGRWLAHITSDTGGFSTTIIIHNQSGSQQMVTLQPYDSEGMALAPVQVSVPANNVSRFAKTDLLPSEASHASITGSTECVVSVGYQSTQPNSSTAHIHETVSVGTEFYFYAGDWDLLFDGLAMINVGDEDAFIQLAQFRNDGQIVGNFSLFAGLKPNAKYLDVLEGQIPPNNPEAIIKITSNQPLAVLALRLTKDSRFLYGNDPITY